MRLVFNMSVFSCFVSEVFYLFRLYDYDRSGLLDGLEMMRLLSDFNSHHAPGAQTSELVKKEWLCVCVTHNLTLLGL